MVWRVEKVKKGQQNRALSMRKLVLTFLWIVGVCPLGELWPSLAASATGGRMGPRFASI